ncbi:MAG TPA: hypothetical protein VMU93_06515 [Caulobacteraceae bacterium]|nr:hypothetical protein [Caulobacteraceae bacterium]
MSNTEIGAKVQIGPLLKESFIFVRRGWAAAPAALVVLVISAAALQGYSSVSQGVSPWPLLIEVLIGTLATGALYRSVLAAEHPDDPRFAVGPGGLQWGALEWRVLGANLLVALLLAIVAALAFIVWVIGLAALAAAHQLDIAALQGAQSQGLAALAHLISGPAWAVTAAVLAPAAALMIYLGVRFSLLALQTADLGRLDFGRAWGLTRGAAGAIFVALVVIFACQFAAGEIALGLADLVAWLTRSADAALLGAIVGAAAVAAFSLPMTVGMAIHVYGAQRGSAVARDRFG